MVEAIVFSTVFSFLVTVVAVDLLLKLREKNNAYWSKEWFKMLLLNAEMAGEETKIFKHHPDASCWMCLKMMPDVHALVEKDGDEVGLGSFKHWFHSGTACFYGIRRETDRNTHTFTFSKPESEKEKKKRVSWLL